MQDTYFRIETMDGWLHFNARSRAMARVQTLQENPQGYLRLTEHELPTVPNTVGKQVGRALINRSEAAAQVCAQKIRAREAEIAASRANLWSRMGATSEAEFLAKIAAEAEAERIARIPKMRKEIDYFRAKLAERAERAPHCPEEFRERFRDETGQLQSDLSQSEGCLSIALKQSSEYRAELLAAGLASGSAEAQKSVEGDITNSEAIRLHSLGVKWWPSDSDSEKD